MSHGASVGDDRPGRGPGWRSGGRFTAASGCHGDDLPGPEGRSSGWWVGGAGGVQNREGFNGGGTSLSGPNATVGGGATDLRTGNDTTRTDPSPVVAEAAARTAMTRSVASPPRQSGGGTGRSG